MKYSIVGGASYLGLTRCTGWVGDKPTDARWLIGVNNQEGGTAWWWMDSIEGIFELTKFYRQEMGFVGDKLPHVAIHLATSPLDPIPVK